MYICSISHTRINIDIQIHELNKMSDSGSSNSMMQEWSKLTLSSKIGRLFVTAGAASSFAVLIALVVSTDFVSINTQSHKLYDGECEILGSGANKDAHPFFINRFCTRSLDAIHVMYPLAAVAAGFSLFAMIHLLRGKSERTGLFHSPAILMLISLALTMASFFTWQSARHQVKFQMHDGVYRSQANIMDGQMYRFTITAMSLTAMTFVYWLVHFSALDKYAENIKERITASGRKNRKTTATGTSF